jgi:hypothetical protein
MIDRRHCLLLLMVIIEWHYYFCIAEKHRVYSEADGQLCFWQGYAPLCFIGSGCPTRTMNMKTSKFGDGEYCWIGHKFYCCL